MKILIVGAGAIGGYFGGRLLEAGRDVTFLVREKRAAQLKAEGLVIQSKLGDVNIKSPPTIAAAQLKAPYDLIIVSMKAYDLKAAMESFAAAVGPNTAILPLLNGMSHLDLLEKRFGAKAVLGGQCIVAATLDGKGHIRHLNDTASLVFGERDGADSPRSAEILKTLSGAKFDSRASSAIVLEMWEKWVFLATLAGITCLMRASVGDIVAAGQGQLTLDLLEECRAIAEAAGAKPRAPFLEQVRGTLSAKGSPLTASLLRDIEKGAPIEADHILGDLLRRKPKGGGGNSLLAVAYANLKAYEARRAREAAKS
jgi:2-dehydropantoate 2-reductase